MDASKPHYFFRIRSLGRILEKNELAKQQIFFAESTALNDPMEGFQDIFWKGDEIEWNALLRHYIQCLAHARCFAILDPAGSTVGFDQVPFRDPDHDKLPIAVRNIHSTIVEEFLATEGIGQFVTDLATRSIPVRRDELSCYLQGLHPIAVSTVQRVFCTNGLAPVTSAPDLPSRSLKRYSASLFSGADKSEAIVEITSRCSRS